MVGFFSELAGHGTCFQAFNPVVCDRSHLMVVVMERWSEPRSSPTVHWFTDDHALLIAVMSGMLRPPVPLFTHVAVP